MLEISIFFFEILKIQNFHYKLCYDRYVINFEVFGFISFYNLSIAFLCTCLSAKHPRITEIRIKNVDFSNIKDLILTR